MAEKNRSSNEDQSHLTPPGSSQPSSVPSIGAASSQSSGSSGAASSQSSGSSGAASGQSAATTSSQFSYHSNDPSSGSHNSSGSSKTEAVSEASTATAPLSEDFVDGEIESDEEKHPEEKSWGRLLPLNERLFKNFLMKNGTYTLGRDITCDYVFQQRVFRNNMSLFNALSKKHFKIFKENHNSRDSNSYTVFLQDLSSNGTFINGERVGQNKKKVLGNNDEICLATRKNKAFMFFDMGDSRLEQEKYPSDLKQKYTVSKVLGTGACGEVRLAFEKETNMRYAVKIISRRTFSVSSTMRSSVMEEVNILRKLKHPGIIKIGDVYDSDEALYIFLELVSGGELFDRVKNQGAFEESIAKLLFYQMLLAVHYLHNNGITHRDLKPENVLLTSDNLETGIKITDFGLSRFVGENSLMKTLCGTPSYLAPEVLKTAGTGGSYSKVVDCWSLGCILYICLGGYPPFSDNVTDMGIHEQIMTGYYNFPPKHWGHVSAEAIDIIKKLINVDQNKRLTVSQALEHPWLQDDEMKTKAEKLMNGLPLSTEMLPPPSIPAVRKSSSTDDSSDSPETKRRRLSTEETDKLSSTGSTGF